MKLIVPQNAFQHGRGGGADDSMRPGVRWIRGRIANFRQPIWIGHGLRIYTRVGRTDGSNWTPKVIRVLGVVERDDAVGHREVDQRKEPRALRSIQTFGQSRRLGDLVPIVLDGAVPERSR